MYKIEAIIRPHLLEAVREALHDVDLIGMTATDVRGEGRQRNATHSFRGSHYANSLAPRVKVEVAVTPDQMDKALDAIQGAATTGEVGDGKIFVTPLHTVVRIRTNERGDAALS